MQRADKIIPPKPKTGYSTRTIPPIPKPDSNNAARRTPSFAAFFFVPFSRLQRHSMG